MSLTDEAALETLDALVTRAKRAGAEACDALLAQSIALSHAQRLGKLERLERQESLDLGLRVFVGRKQASVASTDLSESALDEAVERAVAMARAVPEDRYCGLADPEQLASELPELDICDASEPRPEELIERARACEEAALAIKGVTNSEGAEASWGLSAVALAASNGFRGAYRRSGHSLMVSVLAGSGTAMETDYDYSSAIYGADLDAPEEVGRRAGERAVKRLGACKAKTARVPVVYDPRVSGGLIGHLAGAISGPAVARGTSFLKDSMGQQVLADGLSVIDDPLRKRGLRSRPVDAEGLATRTMNLVDGGRLASWILDLSSARQLGLAPTGHASRGTGGPPAPSTSNLYLTPGKATPEELIADIAQGFYVTSLMGFGVNAVTGDYSRGASGFWIEQGKRAYPVSEVTVAGNLKEMFLAMTPANDLAFRYGTNAPTLRVEGMTVAGN